MIISLTNIKGGCGKTTSAIALATAISRERKQAIVLDADPQGTASEWAWIAENEEDKPLPFEVDSANITKINHLKNTKDYIIIDCPPSGKVTDAAISKADFVVVPTTSSPVDLSKTWEVVNVLQNQNIPHGVLLLKTLTNTLSFKSAISELEEYNISYFDTVIPKREQISNQFGKAFSEELFGYQDIFNQIKGVK